MGTIELVGTHLARLLPRADASTLRRLEDAARPQTFRRRDVLHARGIQLPPFVLLDGHVMYRRVVETGQVRAALIAGPGYFGGLRSISNPGADALYELVALTDGTWATWDPRFVRELALRDAELAVALLDLSSNFAVTLNVRLDEQSFANARQRMAAILTRYGEIIFDTPHPVAQRADLAERHHGGGISIMDRERLAGLVKVAAPGDVPAL
jgi:hypothetical protein